MKGFIKLPYEESSILINTAHIVMVKPLDFGNGVRATEITLSQLSQAFTQDRKDLTPHEFISSLQGREVCVTVPFEDVLKAIEESLA